MPLLDGAAIVALVAYLVSDGVAGVCVATSVAALVAGVVNGVRLCSWRGYRVVAAPSVLILHLGYLWLVVGLLLEAAVPVANGVADMAAIHTLTAGAIGTMLLAAIAHESMVHSGIRGHGDVTVLAAYGLVSIAIVLRIGALFVPGGFVDLIIASGAAWSLGFLSLLAGYARPATASPDARRPFGENRKAV